MARRPDCLRLLIRRQVAPEKLAGGRGFEPGLLGVESDGKTTILYILLFSAPAHRQLDHYPPTNLPRLPLLKYQPRHPWSAGILLPQALHILVTTLTRPLHRAVSVAWSKHVAPHDTPETAWRLMAPLTLPESVVEVLS